MLATRRLLKKYDVAAAFGLAALGLVVVVGCSVASAFGAPAKTTAVTATRNLPPLLDVFAPEQEGEPTGGLTKLDMVLDYNGTPYPFAGITAKGGIPAVMVQLTLPPGAQFVNRKFVATPPCSFHGNRLYPCSWLKGQLKWRLVGGKPTWVFHHLRMLPKPSWLFAVKTADPSQSVCVTATASFPKTLQAKPQTGRSQGCSATPDPATTTTATTTTP